jgi:hypothetical protein
MVVKILSVFWEIATNSGISSRKEMKRKGNKLFE